MKKIRFALCIIVLMPLPGLAHPGHGTTDGYSILHYFTEPVHAVFTYGILFGAAVYIWYTRHSKQPDQKT